MIKKLGYLIFILSMLAFVPTSVAAAPLELDYMEYNSDVNAQAAYVSNSSVTATGGTITEVGGYRIHTFTTVGNNTFTMDVSTSVEVLVVGGGGSGGGNLGGGGGGGGVIYKSSYAVTAQAYTITVGAGGAGVLGIQSGVSGNNGGNSVAFGLTAIGGGGGGAGEGITTPGNGGSGGGGSGYSGSAPGGSGTAGQGNSGGSGGGGSPAYGGGGGGGAGAVGNNGNSSNAGHGGVGVSNPILGTVYYWGGGGGGGAYTSGSAGNGGLGGGGGGSSDIANNGTGGGSALNSGSNGAKQVDYAGSAGASTGGGGGGSHHTITRWYYSGNGGSGIVIVRYPIPSLFDSSESTIKTQGSYALKSTSTITTSLNKTLTRTVSPTINLTDRTTIKFDIRSSRTGNNIKIGIRDSGGTTTEITPNITPADTYQTVTWDISAVSNANKDVIDKIIITIVNADAANTFYIDNLFSPVITPSAPAISSVTANTFTKITWYWTDNSSGASQEDNFKIYTSTGGLIATLSADTTYYEETGLARNKQYSRYVQAINAAGSNNSATVSWRTKPGTYQEKTTTRTGPNSFGFVGDGLWEWEVAAKSGQLVTITAYIRYNTSYGSATKPELTLYNLGVNSNATMSASADTWEQLQVSGTPDRNGVLKLKIEGFSTAPGAKMYVDDIQINQ
ncbi:MAG: glycine-rich domain-containing protein [Elusimicrobiota bacterium]